MSHVLTVSPFHDYVAKLTDALARQDWQSGTVLANELAGAWREGRRVFICGNGGSAANAIHWANDFLYPIAKIRRKGNEKPANVSVLTCLANDFGYDEIFATRERPARGPLTAH